MSNILLYNTGENPMPQFNFLMRVELLYDIPCYKISAINRRLEYEYIQEGGLNDYVHIRRKPFSQPFTFTVSMHTGTMLNDPLQNGTELLLPILIYTSRLPFASPAALIPERIIVFTGCTVVSRTYGELNAETSGILSDDIEIAYREFGIIDIASGAWSNLGIDMPKSNPPKPSEPAEPPAKTEAEKLAEEIKQTEDKAAECDKKIDAAEVKLDALNDKIEDNEKDVKTLEGEVTELQGKRDAITDTESDEYKAADLALKDKEHELEKAKREGEDLALQKAETEKELTEAQIEKAELTEKLSELDKEDHYLQSNEVEEGLTPDEYKAELELTNVDIAALKTNIASLEHEKESNNNLKKKLEAENTITDAKNKELNEQLAAETDKNKKENLANEIKKNEDKIKYNGAVIETLDKINNGVDDSIEDKQKQLADKEKKKAELEKNKKKAELAEIDEEIAEKQQEREEAVAEATALQQDIAAGEKSIKENEKKKAELEAAGKRDEEYDAICEQLDDDKAQLESDKSELENTEKNIGEIEKDIAEKEAQKEAIKSGTPAAPKALTDPVKPDNPDTTT